MNERELTDALNLLTRRVTDLEAQKVIARYDTKTGQLIPRLTWTIVNYNTRVYDTHNAVKTGPTWKFVAPSTGYYAVDAAILFTSTLDWVLGQGGALSIFVNDAIYSSLDRKDNFDSSSTALYMGLGGSDSVYLKAGDKMDIRAYQEKTRVLPDPGSLALHTVKDWNYVSIRQLK